MCMERQHDVDDTTTRRRPGRLVHEFFAAQPFSVRMSFGKPAAEVEIASREIGFHDNGANRFQRFPGNQNVGEGAGTARRRLRFVPYCRPIVNFSIHATESPQYYVNSGCSRFGFLRIPGNCRDHRQTDRLFPSDFCSCFFNPPPKKNFIPLWKQKS